MVLTLYRAKTRETSRLLQGLLFRSVSEHNSESKSDRIRNNALEVTGDPVQPHVVECVACSLIYWKKKTFIVWIIWDLF